MQLKNSPPWSLSSESKVTLPGAHGSEIVRSFCFLDTVSSIHIYLGQQLIKIASNCIDLW